MQLATRNLLGLFGIAAGGVIGGALGLAWLYSGGLPVPLTTSVRPLQPHATVPTFAQAREGRGPTTAELNLVDPKTGKRNDTPVTFKNNHIHSETRVRSTKSVQDALDQPWSVYCTEAGRKRIANALNDYTFHRANQRNMYVSFWGDEGRDYIETAWRASGNQRIVYLLRDQYERGYLFLDDLRANPRTEVLAIIGNVKPQAKPCES